MTNNNNTNNVKAYGSLSQQTPLYGLPRVTIAVVKPGNQPESWSPLKRNSGTAARGLALV